MLLYYLSVYKTIKWSYKASTRIYYDNKNFCSATLQKLLLEQH